VALSEASIEIARRAEDVFPWLLDVEKRLQWVDGLVSSEPLDGERPRHGNRYREVLEQHGLRTPVETTIHVLDPPRELSLRVRAHGLAATTHTRLEEADGRTRVTSSLETDATGLAGRMIGIVVARQAQGSLERSLARLKQLVEAG
jgi:carbon monoxide dehydrogenase subunit G